MSVRILVGDALAMLKTLPDGAVNCIVTSPPYYGLRDYGTATWEGGDPAHNHDRVPARNGRGGSGSHGKQTEGAFPPDLPAEICSCGAVRIDQQIGLEETPEQFVAALVEVFREARRVLRDDGVAFINIGDSYAGSGKGGNPVDSPHQKQATNKGSLTVIGNTAREAARTMGPGMKRVPMRPGSARADGKVTGEAIRNRDGVGPVAGLKAKDLIGIPWLLAFALRADGWYLRQEIIWHKPNPMPESVRDRCTKAHEHVFLLSKSQRYLFDAEAISEPAIKGAAGSSFSTGKTAVHQLDRSSTAEREEGETRNKRDVWTIPTEPSSIAHYAMMPTELAKTCIMAGCPLGGTVLDPFGGAGTTGLVADRLQRNAILIELSPEHAQTARDRLKGEMGMFGSVE